jgi:hypothetical protein
LAGILGAALSAAFTISIVFADTAPSLALAFWPGNGAAHTALADALMGPVLVAEVRNRPAISGLRVEALTAAKNGLREQPLNPQAVRVIAFDGGYSDKQRYAILEAGGRLSKRDALTQLWLIQKSVLAKNLEEVMVHYDALLRLDTGARDIAAQLLARAMADRQVADATARLLRRKPEWRSLLYYYLLRQPDNWDAFIGLHRRLAGTGLIPLETSVQFADRLVKARRFDDAIRTTELAGSQPLTRSSGVLDTRFAIHPALPGTWSVIDPPTASLQPLEDGGALLVAGDGTSGAVARRLIALKPGRYRAVVGYQTPDSVAPLKLEAHVACAESDHAAVGDTFLSVADDCPYQWLSLYLPQSPSTEQEISLKSIRVLGDG